MPRVTVVDVGDGACTVLRCSCVGPACSCDMAVLDCGAYMASSRPAMEALRAVLGREGVKRLQTIVVSHFDADHWAGLQLLGAETLSARLAPSVRIAYPRLPDRAPDTFAAERALFATVKGTGVRSLDLLNTWRSKTATTALPLYRGLSFRAVGRSWRVLWPPLEVAEGQFEALNNAVRAVEGLAGRMAADGDATLRENLEAARESQLDRRLPDDTEIGHWSDETDVHGVPEVDVEDIADEDVVTLDVHGDSVEPPGRFPDLGEILEEHRPEFARVSRQLARANNNLSLVIHDGFLIAYGDAKRSVLQRALVGAPEHFGVALAPHHGTAPVPQPGFPSADACVSQAGSRHHKLWSRHVSSHCQERSCINTAEVGTVSFW